MRRPISFCYRNLVFGETLDDCWGLWRLATRSYSGLTRAGKRELLAEIASLAYSLEADLQLLRVSRAWSPAQYAAACRRAADQAHVSAELGTHLDLHVAALSALGVHRPEVYLAVRLREPDDKARLSDRWLRDVARAFGLGDPRGIPARRLDALLAEEERTGRRITDFVDAEPAASAELEWLVRRAFQRGLGEPEGEELYAPQALVIDERDGGPARLEPLECDLLRLSDRPIDVGSRSVRVACEAAASHQAFLCLGALPAEVAFPGRRAELLFAPLEALPFPVDASLCARYVPNDQAVRLVRRRVVDADNVYAEESHGDHGPSANSAERPRAVRELEQYLTSGERPPLLRASISLAVGAPTAELLEERVEALRREYAPVALHRPLGAQLDLFCQHLPAQRSRVPDYDDYLTVEQVGAMVPVATHAVGSDTGPYIGHTLSGSRQPVLFDPTEASRTSRPPATLLAGTLGSGKTLCMELVMYQAFLHGSSVCDIDPKGDHRLERLPGVAERMEVVELSAADEFRGMLDPLRIAPAETREDLAHNFLVSVLPEPVRPDWQTEIRVAVQTVCRRGGSALGEVVQELECAGGAAADAARALSVHAGSGLAKLGFAEPDAEPPSAGAADVTSLRIRSLQLPLPGTPRSELLEEERVGQAVLRLLAVYALSLTSADPGRHSVLGFDEAWVLLADSAGRALVDRISRLGRAQNVTPMLATQVLGDVAELEGLIGACLCFGVETEAEAAKALALLRLDPDDEALRRQLTSFRRGRCLMRDYQGRVGAVQVDLVDPALVEALDTTPGRELAPDQVG